MEGTRDSGRHDLKEDVLSSNDVWKVFNFSAQFSRTLCAACTLYPSQSLQSYHKNYHPRRHGESRRHIDCLVQTCSAIRSLRLHSNGLPFCHSRHPAIKAMLPFSSTEKAAILVSSEAWSAVSIQRAVVVMFSFYTYSFLGWIKRSFRYSKHAISLAILWSEID